MVQLSSVYREAEGWLWMGVQQARRATCGRAGSGAAPACVQRTACSPPPAHAQPAAASPPARRVVAASAARSRLQWHPPACPQPPSAPPSWIRRWRRSGAAAARRQRRGGEVQVGEPRRAAAYDWPCPRGRGAVQRARGAPYHRPAAKPGARARLQQQAEEVGGGGQRPRVARQLVARGEAVHLWAGQRWFEQDKGKRRRRELGMFGHGLAVG